MKTLLVHNGESQRGFTLIELIIAIAITSVVLAAAASTVYQLLAGNSHNSNAMLATRNLQQAGHWISKDILMAQEILPSVPSTVPAFEDETEIILSPILTLYWFEFTNYDPSPGGDIFSVRHKVVYELTLNTAGTNPLRRTHWQTDPLDHEALDYETETWAEESTQLIASYISFRDTPELSITNPSAGVYKLVITAYVPGFRPVEEQKVFEINPRLG